MIFGVEEVRPMTISLSPKTSKLLARQMKEGGFSSPEDAVRTALESFDQTKGDDIEDLDEETQAAIHRAFAQSRRGQARPWAKVRDELRVKYVGA
jgi:Arc/MetJ-type ribon-helix-helix transcriptional regulator